MKKKLVNIESYLKGFRRHSGLEARYDEINKKFFKGKLSTIPCGFSPKLKRTYAVTVIDRKTNQAVKIMINRVHFHYPSAATISLIHEMIHVKYPGMGHGKKFKKELRRLILAGALDPLV